MPLPPMMPLKKNAVNKKIAAAKARNDKKQAKKEFESTIKKLVDLAETLKVDKEDAVFSVIQEFEEREE